MQIRNRQGFSASGNVNKLLMLVLVVIAIAALAPTIFSYVADLSNNTSVVPGWVSALVGLGAGFALVLIVFAVVGRSK